LAASLINTYLILFCSKDLADEVIDMFLPEETKCLNDEYQMVGSGCNEEGDATGCSSLAKQIDCCTGLKLNLLKANHSFLYIFSFIVSTPDIT